MVPPRRGAILALVSVLAVVLYCLKGSEDGLEGWGRWIEEEAAQRSWRAASPPPRPSSLAEAATTQRAAAAPVKVNYAAKLEELRRPAGAPVREAAVEPEAPAHASKPRPLAEDLVVEQAVASEEQAEEEAALASVVSEAAAEVAVKVAEVQEKLAMARIVKPAPAVVAAVKAEASRALDPKKKDASRYKRLLPLGSPSRRYLYGANFVLSESEKKEQYTEVDDPELTGGKVKVPSKNRLKKLFEQGGKKYEKEAPGWRKFEWEAPPPHGSLDRFVAALQPVRPFHPVVPTLRLF